MAMISRPAYAEAEQWLVHYNSEEHEGGEDHYGKQPF
jgi:hypothetical protein